MKAIVKDIKPRTILTDEDRTDSFEDSMLTYSVDVVPLDNFQNWFVTEDGEWNYHRSWLEFIEE